MGGSVLGNLLQAHLGKFCLEKGSEVKIAEHRQITRSEIHGFRKFVSGLCIFTGLLEQWPKDRLKTSALRRPLGEEVSQIQLGS